MYRCDIANLCLLTKFACKAQVMQCYGGNQRVDCLLKFQAFGLQYFEVFVLLSGFSLWKTGSLFRCICFERSRWAGPESIDLKMRRPMSGLMSERKVMGVWKEQGPTQRSGAQGSILWRNTWGWGCLKWVVS